MKQKQSREETKMEMMPERTIDKMLSKSAYEDMQDTNMTKTGKPTDLNL
jgi:hypothetical protein